MTSKIFRAHLLYYIKLCASLLIHRWIQTEVTVQNAQRFFSRVTSKFDGWPWKTIGHLFHTTLSFVHHFKAMEEFKAELHVSPETLNSGQNRQFFVPCDLEIQRMTLKNNRASLLCCFKLCASFHSHQWIQTRVTVRQRPIWVKIDDFLSRVTLTFDR